MRWLVVTSLLLPPTLAAASGSEDARLRAAIEGLRASPLPSPAGGPLFPRDLRIDRLEREGGRARVVLGGGWDAPEDPRLAEVVEELRLETLLGALTAAEVEGGALVLVPDHGRLRKLGDLGGPRPRVARPAVRPPRAAPKLPLGGALAGKRIALSAGHGWITGTGGWVTQRSRWDFTGCGTCRGILEDFFNADLVTYHVLPLLQGMGAEVVPVREADHSTLAPGIVDDGDPGYSETGPWAPGANQGGWSGDYRTSAPGSGGEASFDATLGTAGLRRVSLRWLQGDNRAQAATARVHHAGGVTELGLDQRLTGVFWLDLGSFWFGPGPARVSLSGDAAGYLVADAVKFGGGVFADAGKPWWQMAAKSYVPAAGAPTAVTDLSDVTIRPAYAEHVGADLYLSIHGNAAGSSGSGTTANGASSYRYSCGTYSDHSPSDSATSCDDPPGSRQALDLVHRAILARVRADWDPNYRDRGRLVADFGELRVLADTPGVLVETGFFDNLASPSGSPPPKYPDNRSMHDPRWREAVARGLAEGVASFLNPGSSAPPVRPGGLRAVNQADGTLLVSWSPVPGAAGYRLYTLADPALGAGRARAFDGGQLVTDPRQVLSGLTARKVYAFRVTALDANGEGLPSQAVAARFRGAKTLAEAPADALVVAAYDRRDAWVQEIDNDFAYSIEHAQALAEADLFFDGALDEVVEDGTVPLAGYALVDWEAGKDSVEHESISEAAQAKLAAFAQAGGALLVSGEDVAFDLVDQGDAADQAFAAATLRAGFLADDADAFDLAEVAGGPLAGVGALAIDDGTKGVYRVEFPDVLAPVAGSSQPALAWPDGRAAGLAAPGVLVFGFPLEAVVPDAARAALFAKAVAYLLPTLAHGDLDLDGASDDCEVAHDFDPADATDGAQDADGDGASNAAECRAGTDPGSGTARPDAGAGPPDASATLVDASSPDSGGADAGPFAPADAAAALTPRVVTAGCGCASSDGSVVLAGAVSLLALRVRPRRRRAAGS